MTLLIAGIVLLFTLVWVGIAVHYAKDEWVPIVSECPDYWDIDVSGNNTTCVNAHYLGVCPSSSDNSPLTMNFTVAALGRV